MKSIILLIVTVLSVSHASIPNIQPKEFSGNVHEIVDNKINTWFGLSSDYIFNTDVNYPPINEDVTFWIYSPSLNRDSDGVNDFTQIFKNVTAVNDISKKLVQDRPIGFLIHGWIDSANSFVNRPGFTGWVKTTAIEWANNNNQSVICVDWHRLANYRYSISVLKNIKLVGKFVGEFVEHLHTTIGISLDNMVIVGHNLGAHISGYVGEYHNGQIGTIIGLDPSGPLFTYPLDIGIENRLDPTDAKFVQVIYTSCDSLGSQINSGHGNFYANGGVLQPGCGHGTNSDSHSPGAVSCSHLRSVLIFQSSCNRRNKYEGVECRIPAVCNVSKTKKSKNHNRLIPIVKPSIRCPHRKTDLFGIYNRRISGSFNLATSSRF